MTKKRIVTREFVLGLIVLAFMGYMSLTTQFSSRNGLFSMMLDVSPTIVGAIAMSLVIFTGNIDISAGTILGFVSFTAGRARRRRRADDPLRSRGDPRRHAPGRAQRLDHGHLQGPLHRGDPGHEHGAPGLLRHVPAATRGGSRTWGTTSPGSAGACSSASSPTSSSSPSSSPRSSSSS